MIHFIALREEILLMLWSIQTMGVGMMDYRVPIFHKKKSYNKKQIPVRTAVTEQGSTLSYGPSARNHTNPLS
jgi:hypothetical protein